MKRKGWKNFSGYMIVGLIIASIAMSGCGQKVVETVEIGVVSQDSPITDVSGTINTLDIGEMFTDRDMKSEYDESTCVLITLNSTEASSDSSSVIITDREIKITEKGSYIIKGTLTNGYILVDVPKDDKVQMILDGVDISCDGMAPIYVKQADKVFLTTGVNSQNYIRNTGSFISIDDNNVDGAIFSKSDLTLNGLGVLSVSSQEGHGIVSKDDLVITGGVYEITAGNHGLSGKDSIRIADGVLDIACKEDGLHSGNDEDPEKGFVYIVGGDITISAEDDGIHGESKVVIGGGNIQITKCYEGIEAAIIEIAGGNIALLADDDGLNASNGSDIYILISGGSLTVDAAGDGLDSNGALYMTGGTVYVSGSVNGGNGALDYDSKAEITGGTIIAVGTEGMDQNFNGGTQASIRVTSSESHSAGEKIELKDNQGNVLVSYEPGKRYNSVIISTPNLQVGQSYSVTMGTEKQDITLDQLIYGGSSEGFGGKGDWHNQPGGKPDRGDWGDFQGARPGKGDREDFQGERPDMGDWGDFQGERPDMGDWGDFQGERPDMGNWGDFHGEKPDEGDGLAGSRDFGKE